MKKIFFILSFSFVSIILFAQINHDNNTIDDLKFSSAIGTDNTSTGLNSFSGGNNATATGDYSFSFGLNSQSTNLMSTALGSNNKAFGINSLSLGYFSKATGATSIAIGRQVEGSNSKSFVIGQGYDSDNYLINNIQSSLMIGFNSNLPTLFIQQADGLDKTGRIGIGNITTPQAKLHIKGDYGETPEIFVENNSDLKVNLWQLKHRTNLAA